MTVHFETSRPVEGPLFVDREAELGRLNTALDKLEAGTSAFIALLGYRKVGKTSLIHEWMRRNATRAKVVFVPVECWAWPDPHDFFRQHLRLTINAAVLGTGAQSSIGLLSHRSSAGNLMKMAISTASGGLTGVSEALQLMADYDETRDHPGLYRQVVQCAERIATRDGIHFQFIFDEFQALARFDGFKSIKQGFGSIYAMLREEWQAQRHCNYVVSGSAISMLRQIIEDPAAPLFQHFTTLHLGPLPPPAALNMLTDFAQRSGREIPRPLCTEIVSLVGTNPYYLQILGEELVIDLNAAVIDEHLWKRTCQRVLFDASGRLFQYFEQLHAQITGNSSMLEKILIVLADGPLRGSEIACRMGVTQNRISSKLPFLERQDAVSKAGVRYQLNDPCYAVWLKNARTPPPNVSSPMILGNASEKQVALELARQGVGLIYQSRASRGAFDLLALYQAHEIGIQVKRIKKYPAYLSEREVGRLRNDARQMGWHPVVAFDCDGIIAFFRLDSGRKTKKGRCYEGGGALLHILDVVGDGDPPKEAASSLRA